MKAGMQMEIQKQYLCANYIASDSFLDIRIKDEFVSSLCETAIAYTDITNKKDGRITILTLLL